MDESPLLGLWKALSGRALPEPALPGRAPPEPALSGRALPDPALSGRALPEPALSGRALPDPALSGRRIPGRLERSPVTGSGAGSRMLPPACASAPAPPLFEEASAAEWPPAFPCCVVRAAGTASNGSLPQATAQAPASASAAV